MTLKFHYLELAVLVDDNTLHIDLRATILFEIVRNRGEGVVNFVSHGGLVFP